MANLFRCGGGAAGTLHKVSLGTQNIADIGYTGQTKNFDVKAYLPDVYTKLSVNNFALLNPISFGQATQNDGGRSSRGVEMSYNANTGILSILSLNQASGYSNTYVYQAEIVAYYIA